MDIQSASFVKSSTGIKDCPEEKHPEYAFIGRSNVGKSSLINFLTRKKNLAKTSASPGKTRLINHFLINESWYIVDLPGYGFAKISKKQRQQLQRMIYQYIDQRQTLECVFVLLDIRHPPREIDLDFMQQLGGAQVPFAMVFTKTDKCSKTEINKKVEAYQQKMLQTWAFLPEIFLTSATKSFGKTEVLQYIELINKRLTE